MNCKHLKIRSKNYNKYVYCNNLKKEISFNDCKGCSNKEYKVTKPIKKRSNKLARAEKNRFSIIVSNLDNCVICGKFAVNKHEIFFGTGQRQISMKYGLVIPLCYQCHLVMHRNSVMQAIWHIKGQEAFEKKYPDLDFMEIFGRSYK